MANKTAVLMKLHAPSTGIRDIIRIVDSPATPGLYFVVYYFKKF